MRITVLGNHSGQKGWRQKARLFRFAALRSEVVVRVDVGQCFAKLRSGTSPSVGPTRHPNPSTQQPNGAPTQTLQNTKAQQVQTKTNVKNWPRRLKTPQSSAPFGPASIGSHVFRELVLGKSSKPKPCFRSPIRPDYDPKIGALETRTTLKVGSCCSNGPQGAKMVLQSARVVLDIDQ